MIPALQNAALDAIRKQATEQQDPLPTPSATYQADSNPPNLFGFQSSFEEPVAKYLTPATSSTIHYAYQNTPEGSPLRKMLADIFAFNAKPEMLNKSLLTLPSEFMVDVLLINMVRLPLRLAGEQADFDLNAEKYHVQDIYHA